MKEIWKDIKGFENYQVSNYGRVKSLERYIYDNIGRKQHIKENILSAGKGHLEHLFVYLYKNGERKQHQVHVLVAQHFIDNPENKPIVHHIDHNPLNNRVDNLMWCTPPEHALFHPEWGKSIAERKSKPINQYDLDGNFIKVWKSACEIQRELGYDHSNICNCCNSKKYCKSAYGYIWKYAEDC